MLFLYIFIISYILNFVYSSNEIILTQAGYNYVGNVTILDTPLDLIVSFSFNVINYIFLYFYF
jgi:hypothetical protein